MPNYARVLSSCGELPTLDTDPIQKISSKWIIYIYTYTYTYIHYIHTYITYIHTYIVKEIVSQLMDHFTMVIARKVISTAPPSWLYFMRLSLKLEYLWLAPFLLGCTRTPRRYWKPFVRATSRSAVCCWTVALTRRNAERRG